MFKQRIEIINPPHGMGLVRESLMVNARYALLMAVASYGLLCFWCGASFAHAPSIRPVRSGETPFVQIEEFVPGSAAVSAEFYAFLNDAPNPQPTISSLQYVEAAGYDPEAGDPYAAGTTVALGTTSEPELELHAHLVLQPDKVYHYRIVASNSEGISETVDQTVQTYPASTGTLPDGRAYEQVSPTAKNDLDALGNGEGMTMLASASGSAFAFFSFEPFPVAVGTSRYTTDYLSTRASSPAAWLTQGVQAPIEPVVGEPNEVAGFTEDLAKTIIQVAGPPLGPSGVINAYVRDNATGSYQLLAPNVGNASILFTGASRDDSRVLFETEDRLLPAAAAGKTNLYEWDEAKSEGERLSLAGVLLDAECAALSEPSGCAPPNGSGAGPGGGEHQGAAGQGYLQNTISEDGSKVFFTAHPSGHIYERELLAEPSPVTIPISSGVATFLAATPSGKYVFYTEGGELYRFDTATETHQVLSSGADEVLGGLGVADDGSYAYFVATGILSANQNGNGEEAMKGAPNLYQWHEDLTTHTVVTMFIARLLPTGLAGDQDDWIASDSGALKEGKTSRVNPSGTALLFMSRASLTGYDNGQLGSSMCSEGFKQIPCPEFFLYNADEALSSTNPVCVSCNPSGAVASAEARLAHGESEVAQEGPEWSAHLTRNLSAGGDRVFFETTESLVPADVNGVGDVYEWERERIGSCPAGDGHCLYLISTGTAHAKSFFGDASASGEDVFFFTRQPLVGQDNDLNFDVYDARVDGGISAQNPRIVHCEGEECKPPSSRSFVFAAPGSGALAGAGNLAPPLSPVVTVPPKKIRCVKGRKLSHGKCVKVKSKKRSRGKRKAKAKKTAKSHRGRGK